MSSITKETWAESTAELHDGSKNTRMQGLTTSELIRCYTAFWRLLKISCGCAFACPKYTAERHLFFFFSHLFQSFFELSFSEKSGSVGTRGREIALLFLFFPTMLSSLKEPILVSDVQRWSSVISPYDLFSVCYGAIVQCCTLLKRHFHKKCPFSGPDHSLKKPNKQKTAFLAEPQLKIKRC